MYAKIIQKLAGYLELLCGILFLSILFFTVSSIILRNMLGISWLFIDTLLRLQFIWMIFIGTAVLYYSFDHLVMDFFKEKFTKKFSNCLFYAIEGISACFMLILIFYGWQISIVRMSIPFDGWKIPTGLAYFAVPVNAFFMLLFTIEHCCRKIRAAKAH